MTVDKGANGNDYKAAIEGRLPPTHRMLDADSLIKETGNYFGVAGNSGARTGNFACKNRYHPRERFSVHIGEMQR
jgi:hypothetical protein